MILTCECNDIAEKAYDYANESLSSEEVEAIGQHLQRCAACRSRIQQFRAMQDVLRTTVGSKAFSPNFNETTGQRLQAIMTNKSDKLSTFMDVEKSESFADRLQVLGGAPWWGVSIMLHVLVILLAGLISMSLELPIAEDVIVIITELQPPAPIQQIEPEKPKNDNRAVLESKHDTPPTDPTSKDPSDIVVPPEILALAELGDHFETINPDRPDTQSAFGNPDSHFFYSIKGNDEPEGGGGMGGCSLDNLIGVGGAASPGSGGGWGGGHGTGIGVGTGAGKGSFGSRTGGGRRLMVKRHGGSRATEERVDIGLEWLARNQEADGHWDNVKHGGIHPDKQANAAMTGFALLAFLGAGHTEKIGKYKENVIKGVKWLIDNQDVSGNWTSVRWTLHYAQGIATMALGEAAAMARIPETKKAAQAAIDALDRQQNQTGPSDREAWDYNPLTGEKHGTNDSSIMSWCILALKSCKVGGLSVNPSAFEGCLNWLNAGQDLGNHKPLDIDPYFEGGKMAYRGTCAAPKKNDWTSAGYAAVTAAAGLCRMMIGGASGDTVGVSGPCNLILKELIPTKYPFNLYFGYYATMLMFQKGGDHWKTWNTAMKKILLEAQCKGGQDDGSWNPKGAGHVDDSRVMSTALAILCLEVYYRYAKMAPGAAAK
ncbi:MAG: zf-HC2 domain-containing protein [Planctomycetota bacterium]